MGTTSERLTVPRRPGGAAQRRNLVVGLLFISPAIIGFFAFTMYPVVAALYYSLTSYNILQPPTFVGLDNYRRLLFNDSDFWVSITNTLYMVVIGLPITLVLDLLIAFLLNLKLRGMSIYRTLIYLPSILPSVATAVVWLFLLNPNYGLIDGALGVLGLPQPGWLLDPSWSKPALIMVSLWASGGMVLIYLAGLQDVPTELLEAAELDGADSIQRTWHVTVPMVTPVVFFNLIIGMIGYFQYFTEAYVMTRGTGSNAIAGDPAGSTLFYAIYLFQNAFDFFKMGYASAQAWILFWLVVVFTVIIFRSSSLWVYYRGRN